jgi:O-antigen/teichoic acid export membrane protein
MGYSNAAYPVLSRLYEQAPARFAQLLRRSLFYGTAASAFVAIGLALAARPIIALLYGLPAYAPSVQLLRLLSPFVVVFLCNALLANGLMAANQQRRSVMVALIKLIAGAIYYVGFTAWLGAPGTALATVLAGLTGTALNYYYLRTYVLPKER